MGECMSDDCSVCVGARLLRILITMALAFMLLSSIGCGRNSGVSSGGLLPGDPNREAPGGANTTAPPAGAEPEAPEYSDLEDILARELCRLGIDRGKASSAAPADEGNVVFDLKARLGTCGARWQ